MSNKEKNNDPIESFFEEKAGDYNIPYEERDWEKLEKRLNKADALYYRRRRRRLAAAVAALLIGVLAYFTYQNHTALNRLNEHLNEQQIVEAENDTTDEQSSVAPDEPIDTNDNSADAQTLQNNTRENIAALQHNQADSPRNESTITTTDQQQNELPDRMISVEEKDALFIADINCATCQTSFGENSEELNQPLQVIPPIQSIAAVASQPSPEENISAEIRTRRKPSIAVGLVMAPDLSTVGGLSNFDNPGYKIGITAEVNLTDRLALTSGIIHSTVNYQAQGREYSPPIGYQGQTISPRRTFAQCALLDIPINLKYDVMHFGRSKLFATAGISSYIMLNEDYQFQYSNYAGDQPREWSEKTGTKHWLSNASFSVGYEWAVHRSWGMQIEPFIRLPLKEVGWGNVKLYSVGTFISLNYKLH